jgi:hypothetical protein
MIAMQHSMPVMYANSMRDKVIGSESVKNHILVVKGPIASYDETIQVSTNRDVIFHKGKWDNKAETNTNTKMRQCHQTNTSWWRILTSTFSSMTGQVCTPLTKSFNGTKHLERG